MTWLRLERTPRTPIKELREGDWARIEGEADVEGDPFISPFTSRRSVMWRVVATRAAGNNDWLLFADEEAGQRFLIRDETGVARVDLRGYSTLLVPKTTIGAPTPAFERNIEAYLDRTELRACAFFDAFGRDYRYSEWVVPHGQRVTVAGRVRATGEVASDSMGYREVRKLMVLEPDERRLVVGEASTPSIP